jgi:hypothetical protein
MNKNSLLILVFGFLLTSCEKKYCWKCTATGQVPGMPSTQNSTTTTVCDQTEDEIRKYEKSGSLTSTSAGTTVVVTTKCTKD